MKFFSSIQSLFLQLPDFDISPIPLFARSCPRTRFNIVKLGEFLRLTQNFSIERARLNNFCLEKLDGSEIALNGIPRPCTYQSYECKQLFNSFNSIHAKNNQKRPNSQRKQSDSFQKFFLLPGLFVFLYLIIRIYGQTIKQLSIYFPNLISTLVFIYRIKGIFTEPGGCSANSLFLNNLSYNQFQKTCPKED